IEFKFREENLDCFNLFLIHQNHVRHGSTTKYIPETMLPKSLDLVLWGHEHDCFADPEYNELTGFHVIQPGSSVATQLTAGESKPKHCLIIDIEGKSFVSHKVPIKSARPFYFEDFIHAYHKIRTDDTNAKEKTIEACENRVRSILKHWRDNGDTNLKPLIRIRVPFSSDGFETFSNLNFGQKFVGNVANPNDIIIFHKLSSRINNSSSHNQASNSRLNNGANNELRAKFIEQSDASDDYNANSQMLYDITQQYIAKYGGFNILNTGKFSRSLAEFIEKDEYNSINEYVESSIKSTTGQLQLILDEIEDCESSKYMEIVDFSKFYTTQLDNIRKRDEAIHIQEEKSECLDTKSLLKKEDAEADEITISGIEEPLEKRTKESLSDLDNKTDQIESISQLSVNLSTTISNSQISHNSERKATHKTRKPRKLFNIPTI
ncbi:MAG: Double-strand break repair protein mre11a, partial [Marteilia pararefringens]